MNKTKLNVEKFGLQVIMVNATNYSPSFAYSIGLWESYEHPEIICFGLSTELGHAIINDVAEKIKSGQKLESGKIYSEIFKSGKAIFLDVDQLNINDYFGPALEFYAGRPFNALQLVWTDRGDKFPWEESFEQDLVYTQPLLDRNADFKFPEPKNLASFTTRQWLEEHKPILQVVHEYDGDWQFLTGDQMPEDIKLVALSSLILKDNTLNQLFDLEYGQMAEREFIGGPWHRSTMELEK
ncbi:DUF4262 domain-containing protein [Pedobacter rhizosphaerae]|nr:DUF4262 domain-containing protein [Pedobacter rhizosphaerae]